MNIEQLPNDDRPPFITTLNNDILLAKRVLRTKATQLSSWFKKHPRQAISAAIASLLLIVGGSLGLVVISQSTELRNQASSGVYASCAGGTAHNDTACDTFRSYVVCNNGLYSKPTQCGDNKICSGGKCINQETVDCLSWDGGRVVKHGSCDNRNGVMQICRYGVYHTPSAGECGTPSNPSPAPTPQAPSTPPATNEPSRVCSPNSITCVGNYRIRICNAAGTQESISNCPTGQQCIDNECKPPPPTHRPSPTPSGTPKATLNPTLMPSPLLPRPSLVSSPLPSPLPSPVILPPTVVCSPGEVECRNPRMLQTCSPNGTTWMLTSCATGKECRDNTCAAVISSPEQSPAADPSPAVVPYTCYVVANNCNTRGQGTPCDSTKLEWDRPEICRLFLPFEKTASGGTGLLGDAEMRGT